MSEYLSPQEQFDAQYVTSYEIQNILKLQRSAVTSANKKGLLPDPIIIPGSRTFIWEREKVMPYIEAWSFVVETRRKRKTG